MLPNILIIIKSSTITLRGGQLTWMSSISYKRIPEYVSIKKTVNILQTSNSQQAIAQQWQP